MRKPKLAPAQVSKDLAFSRFDGLKDEDISIAQGLLHAGMSIASLFLSRTDVLKSLQSRLNDEAL
jgi:hypothetical protein